MDWTKITGINDIAKQASSTHSSTIAEKIYDFYFLEWCSHQDLSPKRDDPALTNFMKQSLERTVEALSKIFIDFLPRAAIGIPGEMRRIFLIAAQELNVPVNDEQETFDFDQEYKDTCVEIVKDLANRMNMNVEECLNTLETLSTSPTGNISQIDVKIQPLIYALRTSPFATIINEGNASTEEWILIYEAIIALTDTTDTSSKILALDHALDIEHTNGYLMEYLTPDAAGAIAALDNKFTITDMSDYIDLVSPQLKPFAQKVIYNITGKTEEMRKMKKSQIDWTKYRYGEAGIPDNWQELLTEEDYPFLYHQLAKAPLEPTDNFEFAYDPQGNIVGYLLWMQRSEGDEYFNFPITRIIDLEINEKSRGQGYFQNMLNTFLSNHPGEKITLQANTSELLETYKQFGFQPYGDPAQTGNYMINWTPEQTKEAKFIDWLEYK